MTRIVLALLFSALAFSALPASAQTVDPDDTWCDEDRHRHTDDAERYCEVRTLTLAPRDVLRADAGSNGGIHVEGWDRDEVVLRARVEARARTRGEAEALADHVTITTDGTIRPRIPDGRDHAWASVSFELMVPRRSNLDLETNNGGIGIDGVVGAIHFDAQNGGVHLSGIGGDVRGKTQNGGLRVILTGSRWDGDRLDVATTNGGVSVIVPDDYSADLETGTVNGGLDIGFPVLLEGSIPRRVRTTLGDGGSPLRIVTTNGGVSIERG